ncbi:hypothetical protein PRK78_007487 [Emydomyces testavorans]|uniref:Uncharacterized protein n=1 Tax=Emydomyces testavorans TaxID=2070801 RepID=A0AAF0DQD0_9EURO|nr:hypothetical protein PRK78_007487 [Emydomyces testavorans]
MATKDDPYRLTVLYDPDRPASRKPQADTEAQETKLQVSHMTTAFDIVAVHGLRGHAINSWTDAETKVMWPRDLLPQVFPNARIMTYGYPSGFQSFTGPDMLGTVATNFLEELRQVRKEKDLNPGLRHTTRWQRTSIVPYVKRLIVDKYCALLKLPGEVEFGLWRDHRDIVRFNSLQDHMFQKVLFNLKLIAEDIGARETRFLLPK